MVFDRDSPETGATETPYSAPFRISISSLALRRERPSRWKLEPRDRSAPKDPARSGPDVPLGGDRRAREISARPPGWAGH